MSFSDVYLVFDALIIKVLEFFDIIKVLGYMASYKVLFFYRNEYHS